MRILIIEDEKPAARLLQRKVEKLGLHVETLLHSVEESLQWFTTNEHPDLIFLDIQLSDGLSFEIFEKIDIKSAVIFTTAFDEYALRAFKLNSIDYLLKPIEYVDFLLASNKASETINKERQFVTTVKKKDDFLFIKSGQQHIRIQFKDIKYLEAQKEYVSINLVHSEPVKTLLRLKNIEDILPKEHFMRIHRSFIVNLNHIVTVERNRIIYGPKEFIVVSDTYQEAFKTFLNNNFFN